MKKRPMEVERFKIGDAVRMVPDTGWRGVITARHPNRNNGYKVHTTTPAETRFENKYSAELARKAPTDFWVRPVSLAKVDSGLRLVRCLDYNGHQNVLFCMAADDDRIGSTNWIDCGPLHNHGRAAHNKSYCQFIDAAGNVYQRFEDWSLSKL